MENSSKCSSHGKICLPPKMDAWNIRLFPFGFRAIFRGVVFFFRECSKCSNQSWKNQDRSLHCKKRGNRTLNLGKIKLGFRGPAFSRQPVFFNGF